MLKQTEEAEMLATLSHIIYIKYQMKERERKKKA